VRRRNANKEDLDDTDSPIMEKGIFITTRLTYLFFTH